MGEARGNENEPADQTEEHQPDERPFVGLDAEEVQDRGAPHEHQGQRHAHDAGIQERGCLHGTACHRHVAQERYEDIGDDTHRGREPKPLGEARDESDVGVDGAAGVDVAAAGSRHAGGEDRVGACGERRGDDRQRVGQRHPRTDAGNVALDHHGDDVDGSADHRADAGRDQTQQAHLPSERRRRRSVGGHRRASYVWLFVKSCG